MGPDPAMTDVLIRRDLETGGGKGCEGRGKRWPSTSKGETPQRKPSLLAP